MRAVVVDAGSSYISALVETIEADAAVSVVARGDDLDQLVAATSAERIDLVVVGADAIDPPRHAGPNALGCIAAMFPTAHVFVVTSRVNADAVAEAASRATALVAEGTDPSDVLAAVRHASSGSVIVQRDIVPRQLEGIGHFPPKIAPGTGEPSPLTARQFEVLRLLAQGKHVAAISRELGISLHTARGHVKSILSKLGSHSQLEAVVKATSLGWLSDA